MTVHQPRDDNFLGGVNNLVARGVPVLDSDDFTVLDNDMYL